jgi:competence protein ComEA
MSDPQFPPRPAPSRSMGEVVGAWLAWFGLARLVLAAFSVVILAAGSYWLIRSEPPPVEARLPVTSAMVPTSTLPPPAGAPAVALDDDDDRLVQVVVHVAGFVARPGVYALDPGARVDDAIRLAGGATPGADLDGLNLAAPVVDGQRVYVPEIGEIDAAEVPPLSPTGDDDPPAGPLDLNLATADELETLPGVGPATASAIVDDRDRNGPFASVDDLDRVPGIGPAKLAALRELVTV